MSEGIGRRRRLDAVHRELRQARRVEGVRRVSRTGQGRHAADDGRGSSRAPKPGLKSQGLFNVKADGPHWTFPRTGADTYSQFKLNHVTDDIYEGAAYVDNVKLNHNLWVRTKKYVAPADEPLAMRLLQGHRKEVRCVAYSADSGRLYSGDTDYACEGERIDWRAGGVSPPREIERFYLPRGANAPRSPCWELRPSARRRPRRVAHRKGGRSQNILSQRRRGASGRPGSSGPARKITTVICSWLLLVGSTFSWRHSSTSNTCGLANAQPGKGAALRRLVDAAFAARGGRGCGRARSRPPRRPRRGRSRAACRRRWSPASRRPGDGPPPADRRSGGSRPACRTAAPVRRRAGGGGGLASGRGVVGRQLFFEHLFLVGQGRLEALGQVAGRLRPVGRVLRQTATGPRPRWPAAPSPGADVGERGGGSVAWASSMSIVERPANGSRPVSSSYRITPTLYRSPRWSDVLAADLLRADVAGRADGEIDVAVGDRAARRCAGRAAWPGRSP